MLPREHTGHSKHLLPTIQDSTHGIIRWSILKSDWLYSLQLKTKKLYTVSINKTQSRLWLRSWALITKFRLKLKKVGKTIRPFSYDLIKSLMIIQWRWWIDSWGLDLVNRVPENLWTEICNIIQEAVTKRKVVLRALTNNWGKKRGKRQGGKGKIYLSEYRVPENSKERLRRPS